MTQQLDSLRVSAPEIVYARLENSAGEDAQVAIEGLVDLFELRRPYDRLGNRAVLECISDAMIKDPSGLVIPDVRPITENAARILTHMKNYPWLRHLRAYGPDREEITMNEFLGMFTEHTVDDSPGLFGVTLREAKLLRAKAHEPRESLLPLLEEVGITHYY